MTTALDVAREPSAVNGLMKSMRKAAKELLDRAADGVSARELEEGVWKLVIAQGGALLSACMATACKVATEADLETRGLEPQDVRLRLDRDYWGTQMSTFGPISFPLFAYRERRGAATITHTPARRELVPTLGRCRSTTLCLEWEARLGKELPFRRAAEALGFFSHGAVREEDTTLAAHAVAVGSVIDREWLYRPVDEIRRILDERAARDLTTGRPIVYLSQDAHAERRFVDETWSAAWKSMNGLRVWTLDRDTGATIHLGGEYTWGDCNQVGEIVEHLIEAGILARDGDYGGTRAELVVVADGLPWIENHVISKLPWAHVVLDLYHALEHIGHFAAKLCGAGTKAATRLYRRFAKLLAPEQRSRTKVPTARKGHKKGKPRRRQRRAEFGSIWTLLDTLYEAEPELTADGTSEPFEALVGYLENNAYRGDYDLYRDRGFQLGSGAMESLHRTAAQTRLKLAGARWTARTSLAVVNLRLLELAGRWDEFWAHDALNDLLRSAFVDVGNCHT